MRIDYTYTYVYLSLYCAHVLENGPQIFSGIAEGVAR